MSAAGHEFPAAAGDRGARWTWLLFAGIAVLGLMVAGRAGLALVAAALVPIAIDVARKPVAYTVDADALTVRRRAAPALRYPLTGAVDRVQPDALGRLWTRRAPGAYVGASGAAADCGRIRYRLTDRRNAVRADTEDGAVVVSPRDPDGFVAMARQR